MPKKKKERGRPPAQPLPPRIEATPEQLARAMFAMPPGHKWKYLEDDGVAEYQCAQCERLVRYPEVLTDTGLCSECKGG